MQTISNGELIDRMEILFPGDKRFQDMRKAYFNHNEMSIFRLLAAQYDVPLKYIRAHRDRKDERQDMYAFMEKIESEFDLPERSQIEPGDLRKFVYHDNEWSLFRVLLDAQPTAIVAGIKRWKNVELDIDSLSRGQLQSKIWLIQELERLNLDFGTVFLCAGWYGILAILMFEHGLKINKIRSFDIDPDVALIADKFNLPWLKDRWRFKAVIGDIHDLEYDNYHYDIIKDDGEAVPHCDTADTVINTSCEHIHDFATWYSKIPQGKIVILQSNNYVDVEEHVNISETLEDFAKITPMTQELYSGHLELSKYTRWMRIGIK